MGKSCHNTFFLVAHPSHYQRTCLVNFPILKHVDTDTIAKPPDPQHRIVDTDRDIKILRTGRYFFKNFLWFKIFRKRKNSVPKPVDMFFFLARTIYDLLSAKSHITSDNKL